MHASNDVIMTTATNPEVLAICYAQGWCASADKMTKAEAEQVASLGTAFRQSNIVHFDELQYFTGLTEIYDRAFQAATSLASVVFPTQITRIGTYAFFNCPIGAAELPNGLTEIDAYAFSGCTSFVASVLASTLTSIGAGAFQNCRSVQFTEWPANAGSAIPFACFAYNYYNPSMHIPSNVTSIGDTAFRSNYRLATIRCDAMNAPTLGTQVFNYCGTQVSGTKQLIVPSGATGYNSGDWQTLQDTYGYTLIYE